MIQNTTPANQPAQPNPMARPNQEEDFIRIRGSPLSLSDTVALVHPLTGCNLRHRHLLQPHHP